MDDTQTRQIFKLVQLRLMITAATVQTLLRKGNFNPDQPPFLRVNRVAGDGRMAPLSQ